MQNENARMSFTIDLLMQLQSQIIYFRINFVALVLILLFCLELIALKEPSKNQSEKGAAPGFLILYHISIVRLTPYKLLGKKTLISCVSKSRKNCDFLLEITEI